MAQSTTARSADERGKIQTRETTRTHSITEANTNRKRRTKETAASRSGKVCVVITVVVHYLLKLFTHGFSQSITLMYFQVITTVSKRQG